MPTHNHIPRQLGHRPHTVFVVLLVLTAMFLPSLQTDLGTSTDKPRTHSAAAYVTTRPPSTGPTTVIPRPAGVLSGAIRGMVDITADLGSGRQSMGTGIVLRDDGLALTNYHVIAHAERVSADDIADGNTYPATVLGADPTRDIALIQLRHASGLPTAELGDSDTVRTGDIVVSLGNAYGLGHPAVGAGPVTHLHRTINSTTDADNPALTGLIEARSNIRPGESGGPMLNQRGEVIGINVAYVREAHSGRPTGNGYAIPINTALRVASRLLVQAEDQ